MTEIPEVQKLRQLRRRSDRWRKLAAVYKRRSQERFVEGVRAGFELAEREAYISTWNGWHEHSPRIDWELATKKLDEFLEKLKKGESP